MARPVILTVDDEPQVLAAIERDLRQHFRNDYRIMKAGSGPEALDVTARLLRRGDPVALFVVDQRMPGMTGTEFLVEALKLYPQARRVLLTAYADTEAAIASINAIGLDYYFIKPWHPPEERLYPVLDDLLSEWAATVPQPYEGIRVAGTLWSSTSHEVKDFLARNRIPYLWMDIEREPQARQLIDTVGTGTLPVVLLPDGDRLVAPSTRQLAARIGLQTEARNPFYDVVVIGAGPAGLAAGVYAVSEGLRCAMIEREAPGGQAGTSSRIENYLGFPTGISGADLAQRAATQAKRFGAEILNARTATALRTENGYQIVTLDDGTELTARAVVVATGVSVRRLQAPGVEPLTGAGVYYGAAMTEAAHYRGRHVVVVGGANSAGQGAVFFSRFARHVTIMIRGQSLREGMSSYLVDQIDALPNVDMLPSADVTAVSGTRGLESITWCNLLTGETGTLAADAMFVFIGAEPHTELVAGLVDRDPAGFIVTGPDLLREGKRPPGWPLERDPFLLETSRPGIFAAGDVRRGAVRRVASAVGEGAIAVTLVHQYLATV